MFKLVKLVVWLVLLVVFIWFGSTVELGKHTLFGHVKRIWASDETQDLVDGVKEKGGPTYDKVKRGVERGMEEAKKVRKDEDQKDEDKKR